MATANDQASHARNSEGGVVRGLDARVRMPGQMRKLVVGRTGRGWAGEAKRRGARGTGWDEVVPVEVLNRARVGAPEDMLLRGRYSQ